jgi:hypothetical protein
VAVFSRPLQLIVLFCVCLVCFLPVEVLRWTREFGQMQDAVRVLRPGRAMHREIVAGPRQTCTHTELPEAARIRGAWYRVE